MPQHHAWGKCPPQTTSYIHIRHIHSVWATGMLSQGLIVAPLYRYTSKVGPRFGKSGSLEKWKWCHNIMFEADIHLRPLHTSILDIYKVFTPLVCCLKGVWLHPYTVTPAKLAPDWKWCRNIMFEANVHLRLLHTSMVDIYKVFEPLVCCLKGVWWHPYTITPVKLPPDLGSQEWKCCPTSWLMLISTSDHFIHPY